MSSGDALAVVALLALAAMIGLALEIHIQLKETLIRLGEIERELLSLKRTQLEHHLLDAHNRPALEIALLTTKRKQLVLREKQEPGREEHARW
jgi:hypothetical protein